MKLIILIAAVILSKPHSPGQEDDFQPVCKLPRAALLSNAHRFTMGRQVTKDSITFHVPSYKDPAAVPSIKLTDSGDKTAMVFKTKNGPVQFSMLLSGNDVKHLRLTYICNFF